MISYSRIILLFLASIQFLSCNVDDVSSSEETAQVYLREANYITYQRIWWDSIIPPKSWTDTFAIVDPNDDTWPTSRESVYNCSNPAVFRNQDTIFLTSYFYEAPDSNYISTFRCKTGTYHRFLLDKKGNGIPLDSEAALANVRVRGDSLLFDQTLVFLERYNLYVHHEEPLLVRYPQYGHQINVDSLQQILIEMDDRPPAWGGRSSGPFYFVAWHTWVYIAVKE